jgi:hypothetical protein
MSKTDTLHGRLGNQFFINVAASLLAEKFNLYIDYEHGDAVKELFPLFVGTQKHITAVIVTDENYLDIYNKDSIDYNLTFRDYFQSKKVTNVTHRYIHSKMKGKRDKNNNCFIHVRLGDVAQWNPGVSYYQNVLSTLDVDNVYLSTDSIDHPIAQTLLHLPKVKLYDASPKDTILFACTNRYVILSHGTFSGMIAYLALHATVYFIKESEKTSWDYNGKFDIFEGKYTTRGPFQSITT